MSLFDYPHGATPLDYDEMDGLKLKHITTRNELNRWEQENIQDALLWIGRRRKKEILTEDFVCRLHEEMFHKVWKWAGSFRKTDKNMGVPWMQVSTSLKQLLDDARYWIDHNTYDPDAIAYRLHHRLVYIHLFPNGNGRHARLMADVLLVEKLGCNPFTWGSDTLTDANKTRSEYIGALKAADVQDYSMLESFVRS